MHNLHYVSTFPFTPLPTRCGFYKWTAPLQKVCRGRGRTCAKPPMGRVCRVTNKVEVRCESCEPASQRLQGWNSPGRWAWCSPCSMFQLLH